MIFQWSKVLTRSDAQRKTAGALMPFLRFTRSNSGHDHRTWFRKVFFEDLDWREGISGRGLPMEWAEIKLDVTIEGAELGVRAMRLDYIPGRALNNSAPTTHLHYDRRTKQVLGSKNYAGWQIVVTRYANGQYSLEVQ